MAHKTPISNATNKNDWFPPLPEVRQNPAPKPDEFITMNWLYETDLEAPGGAPWIRSWHFGTATAPSPGKTCEIVLPTGMQQGNTLLIYVGYGAYTQNLLTVEGCTYWDYSGSTGDRGKFFYKAAIDGSEGVSLTATWQYEALNVYYLVLEIQDASDPAVTGWSISAEAYSSSDSSPTTAALTAANGNCWLFLSCLFCGTASSSNSVITWPYNWDHRRIEESGVLPESGNNSYMFVAAHRTILAAQEAQTWLMSNNPNMALATVAIPGSLTGLVDNMMLAYDAASETWLPQEWFELGLAHEDHIHLGDEGTVYLALDELTDVDVDAAPADKELLAYDSGTGQWINQTAGEADLATDTHDHDADYADIAHNHDADYADIAHNHDADYADIAHNHDADYADIAHAHALDDISDVNAAAPNNNDVLTWDSTPGEWVAAAPAGGSNALDDLTDVNAPAPNDLDVLTWDADPGEWVPQAAGSGPHALDAGQTDVAIDAPADNEVLAYNSGDTTWKNQTAAEAGLMPASAVLADLSDVDATAPDVDDVLAWDGDSWGPVAPSGGGGTQEMVLIYTVPDALAVSSGIVKFMLPIAVTIVSCRALVGTAPVGASAIFDVHKDGTTIYTTQGNRPTITTGNTDSGSWSAPDVTAFSANSYFTIDIDQIGSTTAGANLTLMIRCTRSV